MKLNEVKQIGNYETERTWNNPQTGRVYSADGISPTLNTCNGGDRQPKIVEPMIVASRGRNPQNPSDRTPGNHAEQRLEPSSEGICNTLTSVQKDNLVLEAKKVFGRMGRQAVETFNKEHPEEGDIINPYNHSVDKTGICPTITTRPEGLKTAILPVVKIKQATKEGYIECKLGGVADLSSPTSKTRRGRVQDNGDNCPTLTATETGVCRIETPYRIRKLTPLECWKLMDFTEVDFRRAEEVNSNTQLFKQAGNSIVKAILMAIFKQMM